MFNFRFSRDEKRRLLTKRHDQSKWLFPPLRCHKKYSHSRQKPWSTDSLFVPVSQISYNRLQDITRDSANRMLRQYERDRVFIPCNLKKNIFTNITKGNIGLNARINNCHQTLPWDIFLRLPQMVWFLFLMSFLQPLNQAIHKILITFPH